MGILGGLSKKETMLSAPGEVYDLFELFVKANGGGEKKEEDFD